MSDFGCYYHIHYCYILLIMEDPNKRNQEIKKGEDEISATAADANALEKPDDDSFKSSGQAKNRVSYEVPQDEQMFDNTSPAQSDGQEDEE